ncbi:MAG: site-specific integrase [Planctomycetota bacterium]|nr:site-specific integrase [Planctomycetota bacterium]
MFRTRMRHPLLPGRIVSRSIGTSDEREALEVSRALATMVRNQEWWDCTKFDQAKARFGERAASAFYDPCFGVIAFSLKTVELKPKVDPLLRILVLEKELADRDRKLSILTQATDGLALGEAQTVTVTAAVERFRRELCCKSLAERKLVLRRVRVSTEKLECKLVSLTLESIMAAVATASVGKSDAEKGKRSRDVKRFLVWASGAFNIRALAVLAKQIRTISPSTIARSREVEIIPTVALDRYFAEPVKAGEAIYWHAMTATLVYAGLRLSELAALKWADVDLQDQLVSVRDGEKLTKTTASNRVCHGCEELWPWLERLRPVTAFSAFVFPRLSHGKFLDQSWLERNGDRLRAHPLTLALRNHPLGRKVPMRARRTCRTLMLSRGTAPHLVDLQLGHSSSVGQAHYENARAIVLASVNGAVNGVRGQSASA